MDKVSIEKSTIDQYTLRKPKPGSWWAIINVDEAHGALTIQSDFGDYSYCWGTAGLGCPFKEFLAEKVNIHYLMDKLSQRDYFNEQSTSRELVRLVIEARREANIDSRVAREWYDFIRDRVRDRACHVQEYIELLRDAHYVAGRALWKYFDGMPPLDMDYCPVVYRFFKEIWPEFVAALEGELAVLVHDG